MNVFEEVRSLAEQYESYIIETRRTIHRHPELSLQEYETAALIRRELEAMGIAWQAVGETGTVGTLPATEAGGLTVGLRADIDALPVQEMNDLPFASQVEGKMHACGHDSHTAMLLGAAKILSSMKVRPNTVKFLFQPAEEYGAGAKIMIEGGALEGVDAIYGSHIWPEIPVGTVGLMDGPLMAGADKFVIKVQGKGGHGSQPERCNNPLPACTSICDGIHQVKNLALRGDKPLVLTVGYLRCGTAMNIIPDSGELSGTIRWFDRESQQIARERIRKVAEGSCLMYDCEAQVEFTEVCACTDDDPATEAQARKALVAMFGEEALRDKLQLSLGSEDFSFYGEKIPAAFGLVGCGSDSLKVGLHNPHFILDESVLFRGAALYAAFACSYKK